MTLTVRAWIGCLLVVAPAYFAACGDDDITDVPSDGGADASIPTDSGNDSVDGSADSAVDAGPQAPVATILAVNDLTVVPSAVRVCFLSSTTDAKLELTDAVEMAPQPAVATGILPGKSGRLELPVALTGRSFRPILFYTASLAAFGLSDKSCAELLADSDFASPVDAGADGGITADPITDPNPGGTLFEGADFEVGRTTMRGVVSDDVPQLLLFGGCPRSTPAAVRDAGKCGTTFRAGDSDVRTYFYGLDSAPTEAAFNRVQYVFGSFTAQNLFAAQGYKAYPSLTYRPNGQVVAVYLPGGAATADPANSTPYIEDDVKLTAAGTQVTALSTLDSTYLEYEINTNGFKSEVADILQDSDQTAMVPGKAYVLVSVGELDQPDLIEGRRNLRFFHSLLLPVE